MQPHPYLLEVSKDLLYRRINVSGFFKVIARAVITGLATGEPTQGVAAGSKETVRNLDHQLSTSHRAFELILNGMEAACLQLIQQEKLKITENEALLLSKRLEEKTQELEIQLTPYFFEAPQQLPAIQELVPVLVYWLEGLDLTHVQAAAIGQQLPGLFFRAVVQEWGRRKEYYQPVEAHFEHPFVKAWEEEYNRERYYEELKNLIYEPALKDAKLTLRDLYIKPYFLINNKSLGSSNRVEFGKPKKKERGLLDNNSYYKDDLHDYLLGRLVEEKSPLGLDKKQRLIFLLGQPGQGKSSLCAYLSNQLLSKQQFNKKLYLVRLRDVENSVGLIKDPFKVIKQHLKEEEKLKVRWKEPMVLILDGLDELYMSNGLTNDDLRQFYKALEKKIRLNTTLTILLTSRHHYLNIEKDVNYRRATILKLAPFSLEQQKQWLEIYRTEHSNIKLTVPKLEEVHQEESLKPIRELIGQPILLHLIAKADMEIDGSQKIDRATIYKQLFDRIMNRDWAEEQLEKYALLQTSKDVQRSFRSWLQEIAFTIYNNEYEYITVNELLELPTTIDFHKDKCIETANELEDAAKDLLVAFYFKKVNQNKEQLLTGNQAVEFLHKSLQEYLTVEYIWSRVIKISRKEKIANEELFKVVFEILYKKKLNDNMKDLLVELIEQEDKKTRHVVRDRLKNVFPLCLKHQFLYDYSVKKQFEPLTVMENCFKSFWLILSSLAINPKDNKDLVQGEAQAIFANLLRKFNGVKMNLSYIYLENVNLKQVNLQQARLEGASIRYSYLNYSILKNTNMGKADLFGSDLGDADLSNANLSSTNLNTTSMHNANLSDANLSRAKMHDARLTGSNLKGADLDEVELNGANLKGVNLEDANLKNADLEDANLKNANLINANLENVQLLGANLTGANLYLSYMREDDEIRPFMLFNE